MGYITLAYYLDFACTEHVKRPKDFDVDLSIQVSIEIPNVHSVPVG